MASAAKRLIKSAVGAALGSLAHDRRRKVKEHFELRFWTKLSRHGDLAHERAHYAYFYTSCFGLSIADYSGKKMLDVGCGPLGSLEWATNARLRVGLDPLAHKYRKLPLRSDVDRMQYVAGSSEAIPFQDGSFDYVTCFNCLDHVEDVNATINELKRVVAPAGHILLITEIAHVPTFTEPHRLEANVIEAFAPELTIETSRLFGTRTDHNLYGSVLENVPYRRGQPGILCAKLMRRPAL